MRFSQHVTAILLSSGEETLALWGLVDVFFSAPLGRVMIFTRSVVNVL